MAIHRMNPLNGSRFWWVVSSSLLLAIGLYYLVHDPDFSRPPKPIGDGPDYENIAWNLSQGRGFGFDWESPDWRAPYEIAGSSEVYAEQFSRSGKYCPTTARPPLLPWLIAIVYQFLQRGPDAFATVRIFNAVGIGLSGGLAVAMNIMIMRRYGAHGFAVIMAGLSTFALAAADRTIRTYATDFLTEPLALLLTQGFVFLASTRLWRSTPSTAIAPAELRMASIVGLGLFIASMVLARSMFVFFLPGLGLLIWLHQRSLATHRHSHLQQQTRRLAWVASSYVLIVAILALTPWWVRNSLVLGKWMPLGTQGPISLVGGYSDQALASGGDWQVQPEIELRRAISQTESFRSEIDPIRQELMVAQAATRQVKLWIGDHWRQLPRLFAMRVQSLWGPYSGRSLILKGLMLSGVVWLIVRHRREGIWLIGLPCLSTLVVMLLYSTGGRFLVPCYAIFYQLGGLGLAGWLADCLPRVESPDNSDRIEVIDGDS